MISLRHFDLRHLILPTLAMGISVSPAAAASQIPAGIAGTWVLAGTDVIHKDGSEAPDPDYGDAPKGLMMIDQSGRYSTQIFKQNRPRFASGDKTNGTSAEYKEAIIGGSTHFGTVVVDLAMHTLTFEIQNASFPNWEGQKQVRSFTMTADEIRYSVPARPNGDKPVTIWKRSK